MSNQKEKMIEDPKYKDEIINNENFNSSARGFNLPENYFENFTNYILEHSKLDKVIGNTNLDIGMIMPQDYFTDLAPKTSETISALYGSGVFDQHKSLKIPENYFEKNIDKILSNKNINLLESKQPRSVRIVKSWYYAAAAMFILGLTGWWFQNAVPEQDHWSKNVTEDELFDYVIRNAEDYSLENLLELMPSHDLNFLGLGEDDYLDHINEEDLNL